MRLFNLCNILCEDFCNLFDNNENPFLKVTKEKATVFTDRREDNWAMFLPNNDHQQSIRNLGLGDFRGNIDRETQSINWTKISSVNKSNHEEKVRLGSLDGYVKVKSSPSGYRRERIFNLLGIIEDYKISKIYLPLYNKEEPKMKFFICPDIFFFLSYYLCPAWISLDSLANPVLFAFQTDKGLKPVAAIEPKISFNY